MIPRRRLPRALALACCTTALIPAVAGARPAIDPPVHSPREAGAAAMPGPDEDRAVANDSDAAEIATAAGGALLAAGIAAQVVRRRRRARVVPNRP
jgi:hypothetical protein